MLDACPDGLQIGYSSMVTLQVRVVSPATMPGTMQNVPNARQVAGSEAESSSRVDPKRQ